MDIILLIVGLAILLVTIISGFYFSIKGFKGKDLTTKKDKEIYTKKALVKYSKFMSYCYLVMSSALVLMIVSFFTKLIILTWISGIVMCVTGLAHIAFLIFINSTKGYKKKK